MMLTERPSDDVLYDALVTRDPAYDGLAFVGVTSTGIFCRLTCPARKPKRQNSVFFSSAGACLEAGFRPCLRCRPLAATGQADPVVADLLAALDREPDRRWRERDVEAFGYDPSTVRRAFKRSLGMTFLEIARMRRMASATARLGEGGKVIDAQMDAGFDSASGFRSALAGLMGEAPASLRGRDMMRADWMATPIGPVIAVADRHALHLLEFHDRRALSSELKRLLKTNPGGIGIGRHAPIDQVEAELAAYFSGRNPAFSVSIAEHGSDFTRQVWRALRDIPPGQTRSYQAIAAGIGKPSAVRAVARANGANQVALAIPCHRVIGSDGTLTGYGGGIWRKKWLLEHERRHWPGPSKKNA